MPGVGKVKVIRQSCFATEARVSARHLSGNKNYSREREEKESLLTGHNVSSLVMDRYSYSLVERDDKLNGMLPTHMS